MVVSLKDTPRLGTCDIQTSPDFIHPVFPCITEVLSDPHIEIAQRASHHRVDDRRFYIENPIYGDGLCLKGATEYSASLTPSNPLYPPQIRISIVR